MHQVSEPVHRDRELTNAAYARRVTGYRQGAVAAIVALMVTYASANEVRAQVVEPRDFPVERFRLSYDDAGIIGTEWGAVPGHKVWDAGVWFGAANDPLVLYTFEDGADTRVASLVGQRLSVNLVGSYSLWGRVQFGLDIPLVLSQSRGGAIMDLEGELDSISGAGLGDLRIAPKIQLLRAERHAVDMAITPAFSLPTGSSANYRGDPGVTFQPELSVSRAWGGIRVSGNLGYYMRQQSQLLDLMVDDELFARLGLGYRFSDGGGPPIDLHGVMSISTAARGPFSTENSDHLEFLAGASYQVDRVTPFVVAGVGLQPGFGTPDWRVVIGARIGRPRVKNELPPIVIAPPEPEPCVDDTPDTDGDGIIDRIDQCPEVSENVNQYKDADGCPDEIPDTDGDGIDDLVDACPQQPEDIDSFEDDNGCVDPDNDNDGVLDSHDKCILEPGPVDNEGCPILDSDDDGIIDKLDACPDKPGPLENRGCPDEDTDGDGVIDRLDNCPKTPGSRKRQGCRQRQLVKLSGRKIELLDLIYFETNKATIRRKSFRLLKQVASVINSHDEILLIRVEGHTDSRGDDDYNKSLSQERADSVVKFLINQDVAAERLKPIGYGEERPISSNKDRAGRAANRRVEFNILKYATDEAETSADADASPDASDAKPASEESGSDGERQPE